MPETLTKPSDPRAIGSETPSTWTKLPLTGESPRMDLGTVIWKTFTKRLHTPDGMYVAETLTWTGTTLVDGDPIGWGRSRLAFGYESSVYGREPGEPGFKRSSLWG